MEAGYWSVFSEFKTIPYYFNIALRGIRDMENNIEFISFLKLCIISGNQYFKFYCDNGIFKCLNWWIQSKRHIS